MYQTIFLSPAPYTCTTSFPAVIVYFQAEKTMDFLPPKSLLYHLISFLFLCKIPHTVKYFFDKIEKGEGQNWPPPAIYFILYFQMPLFQNLSVKTACSYSLYNSYLCAFASLK